MNKLKVLIPLLLVSCIGFSQSLAPDTVVASKSDTLLCWSIAKSKSIAQVLISYKYCDSIATELDSTVIFQQRYIIEQNHEGALLRSAISNMNEVNYIKDQIIQSHKKTITSQNKQIKRQKRLRFIYLAIGVLAGYAVFSL